MKKLLGLLCVLLAACGGVPTSTPAPLQVQYTFSAQVWLGDLAECAGEAPVLSELRAADHLRPEGQVLAMRIGVPSPLLSPAYQVGTEEVLVVIHPQNSVTSLTAEQVRGLFGGTILNWRQIGGADRPVQAWAFGRGEDVQQIFEAVVMQGAPLGSSVWLAAGPEDMGSQVGSDPGAIGLLTTRWTAANVRIAYTAAAVPVVVLAAAEASGELEPLLACLQD